MKSCVRPTINCSQETFSNLKQPSNVKQVGPFTASLEQLGSVTNKITQTFSADSFNAALANDDMYPMLYSYIFTDDQEQEKISLMSFRYLRVSANLAACSFCEPSFAKLLVRTNLIPEKNGGHAQ